MTRLDINFFLNEDNDIDPGNARRIRKRIKRTQHAILDEIAQHQSLESLGAEVAFNPSLGSSRWEREWIFTYLGQLYNTEYITDVVRRIKGGKEANVYVCEAHPSTRQDLLAAKLYRPRMLRNLRNDVRYRANRTVLDEYGKGADERMLRAVRKGTTFGKELAHTSWLQHEYRTLQLLYDAGVSVPEPITVSENTILMAYVGDLDLPAPNLTETTLTHREARDAFDAIIEDVERMLSVGRIHADLSAYNVLYWNHRAVLIDFPQAISPDENSEAWDIFRRDVARICEHFTRYGIRTHPRQLAKRIWMKHRIDPDIVPIDEWEEPAD